ncbi:hypothetical protein [Streptomyces sp. I8-5]
MTNQEFEAVQEQVAAYVKATSFGTPDDDADAEHHTHTEHAEYGAAQH